MSFFHVIAWVLAAPSAVTAPAAPAEKAPAGQAAQAVEPPIDLVWMIDRPVEDPLPPAPAITAQVTRAGRSLYRAHCAGCHGLEGRGDGPLAARLKVAPTDFTRGVFKVRSTPTGALPTDADLFRTITRGHHGTPMLPASELDAKARWALVFHVEALSRRFADEPRPAPVTVPKPPAETTALRVRGHALYHQLRCVACHGEQGAGDGPAAAGYASEPERQVRIRDFTRGRFIRGAELTDIFLTLRTGLDGTPMGSYDGVPVDDLWALAAYVRDLVRERPLPTFPAAGVSVAGPAR